ncbi:BEN domain-containing protein 5-like [Dermacentor albipictus]|uniref:BEN domain-containing protein 5-like n=1 Tax=Dermacentor albipictus TaxID=60249 RepID=UPI0038FD1C7B
MFAYVQYLIDGKTAVVKHSAITDFKPKNVADFQPTKSYSVYWAGDDSTDGDFYEARILHLTESMEEMKAYMEKRPRKVVVDLPKGRKRNKEKVEQSQKKLRTDARKKSELELVDEVLQDDESDFVPRSVYTALQLELQAVQSELDSLREQLRQNTHAVSSAQQVPQDQSSALLRGTCICAEEHYKELKEEVRQLRGMNMELQKTLSYKLFQSESRVVYATSFDVSVRAQPDPVTPLNIGGSTTSVVPAPRVHCQTGRARLPLHRTTVPEELAHRESATVQQDAAADDSPECGTPHNNDAAASNFDRSGELESVETLAPVPLENIGDLHCEEVADADFQYGNSEFVIGSRRDDGKVYAGSGFWVDQKAWDCLFSASTDSMFCRSAATVLWTAEQLKTRSVTGTLSNKARSLGYTEAKPPLTPEKISSLKAMLAIYMGDVPKEVADKRMKMVRKHLSQKLGDVQRR